MSDYYEVLVPKRHAHRFIDALQWASEMAADNYRASDGYRKHYKAFELALDHVTAELEAEMRSRQQKAGR